MPSIAAEGSVWIAICPRGVAQLKPSGTAGPKPNGRPVATHTRSPLMLAGYAKNRKARATSATLSTLYPVPPNTSFTKTTEKATATAIIHSGVSAGHIMGTRMPVTRKPSWISSRRHWATANSMPSPTTYATATRGRMVRKP